MDITDYKPGSAYIRLPRSAFADETYFNNLLSFLKLPKDIQEITVSVNRPYCSDSNFRPQNYVGKKCRFGEEIKSGE